MGGQTKTVGILPIGGFPLLSFASVVEPFRFANEISGQRLYELMVIGQGPDAVPSAGPAVIPVDCEMTSELRPDYLFVIAGGRPEEFDDRKTLNWIAQVAKGPTRVAGVSGGPVILANARVLAGHRMTVHWEHAPALLEKYPGLLLEKTLFTMDRKILTCGGGAAALDMTLALIESDHGADLMYRVSDWSLHTEIREASRAQRRKVQKNIGRSTASVLRAISIMENNIAMPVPAAELATEARLSERQLNRLFKQATGETLMEYYRNMRLDTAANLLKGSALSITEIAVATGFSSSSHFSECYRVKFGQPPSSAR